MKQILIEDCNHCHYNGHDYAGIKKGWCAHKETWLKRIDNLRGIPDWCFLDDKEGGDI